MIDQHVNMLVNELYVHWERSKPGYAMVNTSTAETWKELFKSANYHVSLLDGVFEYVALVARLESRACS